jgi:UDP-N-acetylglucosamine 2-epimerase
MELNNVVVSVVGARPHFVKAFPLLKPMASLQSKHFIIHTGQHYDYNMSALFFEQFDMPAPDANLNVGSGTHAEQTAKVMLGVEKIVCELRPKAVIVFGDTNSTLAAALAAAKYYFPVVHVEAGVRCFNRRMPEEINRTLIDHMSDYLICPSELAVQNLHKERVTNGVLNVGDLMYDSFLFGKSAATKRASVLGGYEVEPGGYILSTLHREATTEDPEALSNILKTFERLGEPVILPMHPRTRHLISNSGVVLDKRSSLKIIDPVGYLDMLQLILGARKIATDSGGLQKEAYWAGVPCITLMNETTWTETVDAGWNTLVGLSTQLLNTALKAPLPTGERPEVYGAPGAARRLIEALGWR